MNTNHGFGLGDEVRTIKGAAFRGIIIGFHRADSAVGCVVEANHEWFKGVRHVYSLKQLERVYPNDLRSTP